MAKNAKNEFHPKKLLILLFSKQSGFIALFGGIILTLILGIFSRPLLWPDYWMNYVVILGLLIGIINFFHEETVLFILSTLTIAFMLTVMVFSPVLSVWSFVFEPVLYLIAPTGAIAGFKVIYALAVSNKKQRV